jgi:hypothetical protein
MPATAARDNCLSLGRCLYVPTMTNDGAEEGNRSHGQEATYVETVEWASVLVRRCEAIHMPDHGSLMIHFAGAIDANGRATGAQRWIRREVDIRQLAYTNHF